MNDEFIRMARKAGLATDDRGRPKGYAEYCIRLSRFADLVAAAEREACAKAIENSIGQIPDTSDLANGYIQAAKDIAEGIRARNAAK